MSFLQNDLQFIKSIKNNYRLFFFSSVLSIYWQMVSVSVAHRLTQRLWNTIIEWNASTHQQQTNHVWHVFSYLVMMCLIVLVKRLTPNVSECCSEVSLTISWCGLRVNTCFPESGSQYLLSHRHQWRQCGGRWNQLHHGSITTMATVSEANSRVTGNQEQARERLSEQGREESVILAFWSLFFFFFFLQKEK